MSQPLTLMAIHAHPDDESISTGGILARYADEGIHTVLVTCTGGEVGEIAHPTLASSEDLHVVRESELRAACEILGIRTLELLGYRDSGMMGTEPNRHPDCFYQADLDVAVGKLVALVREHRPQVLVSYDENGFYGHPDHIYANRITVRAFERAGDPAWYPWAGTTPWQPLKLYYTAVSRSRMAAFGQRLREHGIRPPLDNENPDVPPFGTPDELITTIADVTPYVRRKREALWQHRTQLGPEVFFSKLSPELFEELFAHEAFQRVASRIPTPHHEDDLFAGLR
ncbi:MAG: N-acetyl-1-D-myo-inositol-2-amino-2-deoxy-alpha-D-glucopyranoside deacetylase [Chloroflexota bacterium]